MKYSKQNFVGGAWVKGAELANGVKCQIVSETQPQASKFQNKDGSVKMQDVAKIRFQGLNDVLNINLNRATINGLVDAFGDDSKDWMGKTLTVATEKVQVAGKRVTAVYLLPEGYEVLEDEAGYVIIVNPNKESVPVGEETVNVEDIPF